MLSSCAESDEILFREYPFGLCLGKRLSIIHEVEQALVVPFAWAVKGHHLLRRLEKIGCPRSEQPWPVVIIYLLTVCAEFLLNHGEQFFPTF